MRDTNFEAFGTADGNWGFIATVPLKSVYSYEGKKDCPCVCHVGVSGSWRAHACSCPLCPGKRPK